MASELELTETAVRAWVKRADIDVRSGSPAPVTIRFAPAGLRDVHSARSNSTSASRRSSPS
ncbi:MAG: hypothetical protein ABUS79_02315 [Pseudomonadota bacterium]